MSTELNLREYLELIQVNSKSANKPSLYKLVRQHIIQIVSTDILASTHR